MLRPSVSRFIITELLLWLLLLLWWWWWLLLTGVLGVVAVLVVEKKCERKKKKKFKSKWPLWRFPVVFQSSIFVANSYGQTFFIDNA